MSMNFYPDHIHGWDGYRLENGDISLGLVPRLGGRVMSLRFKGEELFFHQKERAGEFFDFSQLAVPKKEFGFGVWGGDKTWVGPENSWVDKIPPLDLDAGPYDLTWDGRLARMKSGLCRETGLRITREIGFDKKRRIQLTESIKNESGTAMKRGIWNVTQVLRPGDVYIFCPLDKVRLYDETAYKNCEPEKYLKSEGVWTGIHCADNEHFKFGALIEHGKIMAVRKTQNGMITFEKNFLTDAAKNFVHQSNVEVYNSPAFPYCEIEIHSPSAELKPGESLEMSQNWILGFEDRKITANQILKEVEMSPFDFRKILL